MATLAEVRARLRRALEDTDTTAPLWTDTELNELLASAHREYGARFSREATATLPLVPDQLDYALPDGARRVLRVESPAGTGIPRRPPGAGSEPGAAQTWALFGGLLRFAVAPVAPVVVLYRGLYPFPASDAGEFGLPDEGIDLAVTGALILALQRRETQVAKRNGTPPPISLALASARRAYAERLAACRQFRATQLLS